MRKYSSVNDVDMILSSSDLSLYLFTVSFYIHFVNNIYLVEDFLERKNNINIKYKLN